MSVVSMRLLSVGVVTSLFIGCDLPEKETEWGYENCTGNSSVTGDNFGIGYYPEQSNSDGDECQCSYSFTDTDLKIASVFEAGGTLSEPLAHVMSIGTAFSTGVKNPTPSGSPHVATWEWYSDIVASAPNTETDYSGSWTMNFTVLDSDENEMTCSDSNPGYYVEWARSMNYSGGSGWKIPGGGAWDGTITMLHHPDQPTRTTDGSTLSYPILVDGNPLINGVEIHSLSLLDAGTATGVIIDGAYYDIDDNPALNMNFDADVRVIFGDGTPISPTFAAAGVSQSAASSDAPGEGYVIPGWLSRAVSGFSQPLVVQMTNGSTPGLMLTAVGSGMTRGVALDSNGYFSRSAGADGWSFSGKAEELSDGLRITELEVSRWEITIPVPGNYFLPPVPAEQ